MKSEQTHHTDISSHIIVIGGGITGLLSARIFAEKATSVTVIERDILPSKPSSRKGVPQSVQPHTLLVKGYRLLEENFPGIGIKLTKAGALEIDWAREFHLFDKVGLRANAQSPSDIISFTCSRSLLEWVIRQELSKFTNVHFVEGQRVIGLIYDATINRIKGVHLRSTNNSSTKSEVLATLVVDASGRSSNAPEWLESVGLTSPPETVVNPFLGYATRIYEEPKDFQANWKIMLISPSAPDHTRLGYLARIEGGKWVATIGGYSHDFPPIDNAGFLEFAHSLPSSKFYQTILQGKSVSPIYAHRATANRLRHYEKVTMPQGFIALGDSVCALCPVYGQGITVSVLSAESLRNQLQKFSIRDFCVNSFQQNLAKSNSPHWSLATQLDSQFSATVKRSELSLYSNLKAKKMPPGMIARALRWYIKQFLIKTTKDSNLNTLWLETIHLLKKPTVFFHPSVIIKVLWH